MPDPSLIGETLKHIRIPAGTRPMEAFPTDTAETVEDVAERLAQQAAARRRRWERLRPARYADADIATLTPEQDPGGRIAGWWDSGAMNLILFSATPGIGKTHGAMAVGQYAVDKGASVEVWTSIALLAALRPSGEDPAATMRRVCEADLLILDDLGKESSDRDWVREQLYLVIDSRAGARRRTIITTNLEGEEFGQRYDSSLLDRLADDAVIVEVKGVRRRKPVRWGAE